VWCSGCRAQTWTALWHLLVTLRHIDMNRLQLQDQGLHAIGESQRKIHSYARYYQMQCAVLCVSVHVVQYLYVVLFIYNVC